MARMSTFAFILAIICALLDSAFTTIPVADTINRTSDSNQESFNLFVKEIFEKYGDNGVITLEGFEHLLENLGLGGLKFDSDHDVSHHRVVNQSFTNLHDPGHSHTTPKNDQHHHHHEGTTANVQHSSDVTPPHLSAAENQSVVVIKEKCLNTTEILLNINANPNRPVISVDSFLSLCPIIVYELDQPHCRSGSTRSNPHYEFDHEDVPASSNKTEVQSREDDYIWAYSTLAVLIISISGMLCVAIIPIIQRCFYQQLIQYLVALAIGSLTGDALLHLLPHAMLAVMSNKSSGSDGHSHGENDGGSHTQTVWVGLMALGGICIFFTAEQGLNALNSWKQRRDKKKPASVSTLKGSDHELSQFADKQTYNSYGYEYEQVATEMTKLSDKYNEDFEKSSDKDIDNAEKAFLKSNVTAISSVQNGIAKDISNPLFHSNPKFVDAAPGIEVEHSSPHHGHGHSHNHSVPTTTMATAWMVIAGDGLHNFSDGMAIGAAFTNGMTGGLSTAIAVFCHELPHELGDFALLLKAGMSIKQGLFYNGLSSILCFMGMFVGLAIGNIQSANAWVFAGAAGMFLYIALVDMVPELHTESGGSSLGKFLIQASGIATGITVMCLIALYEEDLQKTLET
ncbi:hypothetical protein CHUAL_000744 [Chamberlinius hualienensis]